MAVDSLDIAGATLAFPDQVADAARAAAGMGGLPAHDTIDSIAILGVGVSGLAGDVVAAVGGPFAPVPVVVTKGYAPPSFVGPGTMCFALSFSGETEETVEAAQAAAAAGAHMVVVSQGGRLAELAPRWQAPLLSLPAGIPTPRAALGAMTVPLLILLEQVGLFPGAIAWVDSAVAQLYARRVQLEPLDSQAVQLARTIGRTIPLVVGAGPIGQVAALRWKNQINENAKAPAFTAALPEMCHNEICGWGQHGDVTRQVFTLVELRHDEEHPQEVERFDMIREIMAEVVHEVVEVRAEGDGPLAQLFDLTFVGDAVSLHMALQQGIDPGPTPAKDPFRD